jgi:hypothetical protein
MRSALLDYINAEIYGSDVLYHTGQEILFSTRTKQIHKVLFYNNIINLI